MNLNNHAERILRELENILTSRYDVFYLNGSEERTEGPTGGCVDAKKIEELINKYKFIRGR